MENIEIDLLLGTELMGWEFNPPVAYYEIDGLPNAMLITKFKPTVDIDQAMECVDVMINDGWTIEMRLSAEEGIGMSVLVRRKAQLTRYYLYDLSNLPLTICRAIISVKDLK